MTEIAFAAAGISGFLGTGALLYRLIRPRFPITVNCWFCNQNTEVLYRNRNSWDCPYCDQYNGFSKDGDYNKDIPAHSDDSYNFQTPNTSGKWKTNVPTSNGLCDTCNRNQQLKIKALANFVPLQEDDFQIEAEEYKENLERIYKLCRNCEAVLRQTLGQQDSWLRPRLLSWKLQNSCNISSSSNVSSSLNPAFKSSYLPSFIVVLRILITLLTSNLFNGILHLWLTEYFDDKSFVKYWPVFPITNLVGCDRAEEYFILFGFGLHLLVLFYSGRSRSNMNILEATMCPVWILLLITSSPSAKGLTSDVYLQLIRLISSGLIVVIATLCLFFHKYKQIPQFRVHRMSLGSRHLNSSLDDNSGSTCFQESKETTFNQVQDNHITSTNHRADGLNFSLGSMKIGSPSKPVRKTGIFTLQNYSSPKSFSTSSMYSYCSNSNSDLRIRKPILSPPRLQPRYFSESSWMSGGYWNSGNLGLKANMPPRPHSVSPSLYPSFQVQDRHSPCSCYSYPVFFTGDMYGGFPSGHRPFYSPSCPSSRPTSRQGSICGDDRASVYSEPSYPSFHLYQQEPMLPNKNEFVNFHSDIMSEHSSESSKSTNKSRVSKASSTCPVDTTTADEENSEGKWLRSWQQWALGLSISVNLLLVTYFYHLYVGR